MTEPDGLPIDAMIRLAGLYAALPLPRWTLVQEGVTHAPRIERRDLIGLIDATSALARFDFVVTEPALLDRDHVEVRLERDDAYVRVIYAQGLVSVVFGTADDRAAFGAFPVRAGESIVDAVTRVVRWFLDASGAWVTDRPLPVETLRVRGEEFVAAETRFVLLRYHEQAVREAAAAGRHRALVEHLDALALLRPLTDAEESQRVHGQGTRSPEIVVPRAPTPDVVRALAADVAGTHDDLRSRFAQRDSPGGLARWEDAAYLARDALGQFEELVSRLRDGMRVGDPVAIEGTLMFLEVDPWCFRSGYAKGRLMRQLGQCTLTPADRDRAVAIVLRLVDQGGRAELGEATRLARRIASRDLRRELRARLHGEDVGIARRALLVLNRLRRPKFTGRDVARVRSLIVDELDSRASATAWQWWPDWPERIGRLLLGPDWAAAMLTEVRSNGPRRAGALVVLTLHDRVELEEPDRHMLRTLLLALVRDGGDERWLERMAVLLDDAALRAELRELVDSPDDEVRRRAWWGLNAIRRHGADAAGA